MKSIRTRRFRIALYSSLSAAAIFLLWISVFGIKLAQTHFNGVADAVFAVLVLAATSFVAFCFVPYFRGERRWFSISVIFAVVFLMGTAVLWQVPAPVVAA